MTPEDAATPRERARALRRQGRTYAEIVAEVGVAKSTVSRWVRDLPRPSTPPERLRRMSEARWARHRRDVALRRTRTRAEAAAQVGRLSERELLLVGAGLYWAEGAKSKPYRTQEQIQFVNSDPGMIRVFLAWLALLGVGKDRLQLRLMIHETADVAGALEYWAALVGVDATAFSKTTLKKHNPKTVRKNVGAEYRGCLVVGVRGGAEIYRRVEGWWCGIVWGAEAAQEGELSE
ncbi:helix-turn-helix transcriptional regulator [Streptomyces durbertensis]|uniref:Helix-turn-helix transcriptional regulator n=1 Tax=Streptomyces durbertensis TaxID=2448886 RepID=A0ABR6EH93_9ACTN|nr:helix-turn-helix transcriptional regulator [Streptomyces durbertensis]